MSESSQRLPSPGSKDPAPSPGALRIDHVVLYSGDSEATIRFYEGLLGFRTTGVDEWRSGQRPTFRIRVADGQFINVHPAGSDLHPKALSAHPGGLDLCILTDEPLDVISARLALCGVPVEVGPVKRTTALDEESHSIYIRDPDGNLLEFMRRARLS